MIRRRRWTAAEVRTLEHEWGERGSDVIARMLGRSRTSVERYARRRGLGAPNRGRMTPHGIAAEYGYHRARVLKACERLGVKFGRAIVGVGTAKERAPGRRMYIPEERFDEVIAFLAAWPDGRRLYALGGKKTDATMWGTGGKPDACRACGTKDRPHRSRGWCAACASRETMRERRAAAKGSRA